MAKRIKPTPRQIRFLILHMIAFAIGVTLMWTLYDKGVKGWAYPWPAWTTAAWGFWLLGHMCVLAASYEDKGLNKYIREDRNV